MITDDVFYARVEDLLQGMSEIREDLERRECYLIEAHATVVEGVVLRPPPLDRDRVKGTPDPFNKIENDLRQIEADRRECVRELGYVRQEIEEMQRLARLVRRLPGRPGVVLRGLYLEGKTWSALKRELGCAHNTIKYHRQRGIQEIARQLHARP